jgi:predicted enzyme related to lactoylglutathione lyase
MIFKFGRYVVDVDVEKTKAFYDSAFSLPTNEVCSCVRCQRFPKAILSSSEGVLAFFHSLGIHPAKAGEVFGVSNENEYANHYSGWYHVVGTIVEGRLTDGMMDDTNAFMPDGNTNFQVWFEDDPNRMGWIEKNFPHPVLEISFSAVLLR